MQAIEGDGSPWSYLSASILRREAAEFGARWPGYVWSDQTILSKPPRQADDPAVSDDEWALTGDAPSATGRGAAPVHAGGSRPMPRGDRPGRSSCIHDPVAGDKIYRATDTYRAGSYDCKTRTTVLCKGDRGILY